MEQPIDGRGCELLKTVSKRISLHFPQIQEIYSLFRNWSITRVHDPIDTDSEIEFMEQTIDTDSEIGMGSILLAGLASGAITLIDESKVLPDPVKDPLKLAPKIGILIW